MARKKYNIEYTFSSRDDIRDMKKYILDNFKYRELGENFTKKIRKATNGLKTLPTAHNITGFVYKGYKIYVKPYLTYLIFYVVSEDENKVTILRVMQDGMNWQYILRKWLKENK